MTAASLVAEIGDDRTRFPSAEVPAADAGMAPIARESGKRKVAAFRWACDKRLRDAVSCLANGCGFSGAAGKTDSRMTPPNKAT